MRFAPLGCVLLWALAGGCEQGPPNKPHVLLVVVDTLRADHVGSYGGPVPTPAMDSIASRGVQFDQAFAHAPMTAPSHGSMFTGVLPRRHGLLINGRPLPAGHPTLAESLRSRGYRTAAFVSLQVLARKYGFARGFQTYDDEYDGWWRTAEQVNADALPWLRRQGSKPFFLFVHYSDPHEPYLPPPRYPRVRLESEGSTVAELAADGGPHHITVPLEPGENVLELVRADDSEWPLRIKALRTDAPVESRFGKGFRRNKLRPDRSRGAILLSYEGPEKKRVGFRIVVRPVLPPADRRRFYGEEVAYVDRALGELLQLLEDEDLIDDTLIVLTSDHGEELGHRGGFFGHVHNLYDELIRVPWMMALPRRIPPRTVVGQPVRHVDLAPTIQRLVGAEPFRGVEGASAWPPSQIGSRLIFAETHKPQARADKWAVRMERHKVIQNVSRKRREVYDLELSPGERKTLADLARERARETLKSPPRKPRKRHRLSEEEREALKALGYAE